jgi:hypothetical protein
MENNEQEDSGNDTVITPSQNHVGEKTPRQLYDEKSANQIADLDISYGDTALSKIKSQNDDLRPKATILASAEEPVLLPIDRSHSKEPVDPHQIAITLNENPRHYTFSQMQEVKSNAPPEPSLQSKPRGDYKITQAGDPNIAKYVQEEEQSDRANANPAREENLHTTDRLETETPFVGNRKVSQVVSVDQVLLTRARTQRNALGVLAILLVLILFGMLGISMVNSRQMDRLQFII